jgi:hypothetical protein
MIEIAAGSLDSAASTRQQAKNEASPLLHGSFFYRYTVTLASPVNTRTPPFHTAHLLSRPGLVFCRFAAFLDSPGTPIVELLTSVFSFIPDSYQANHVLLVLNRHGMLL